MIKYALLLFFTYLLLNIAGNVINAIILLATSISCVAVALCIYIAIKLNGKSNEDKVIIFSDLIKLLNLCLLGQFQYEHLLYMYYKLQG